MKGIISIGLMLLMSLQCFYKLGIMTYFQLNRDYIAEVLCINKEKPITMCYGQCFLDKSLDLAEDQHPDEGTVPVGKQKVDFPVFIVSETRYTLHGLTLSELHNVQYRDSISVEHSPAPFHPPAVIC